MCINPFCQQVIQVFSQADCIVSYWGGENETVSWLMLESCGGLKILHIVCTGFWDPCLSHNIFNRTPWLGRFLVACTCVYKSICCYEMYVKCDSMNVRGVHVLCERGHDLQTNPLVPVLVGVHRVTVRKNGEVIPTSTLFFTKFFRNFQTNCYPFVNLFCGPTQEPVLATANTGKKSLREALRNANEWTGTA